MSDNAAQDRPHRGSSERGADRAESQPEHRDCHILHVDMDAFYASVAVRDNPTLRGKPVIVGHAGGRGVVLSATYEARALGVRSAIPVSAALRLAPHATLVEPVHHRYAEVSAAVMAIFRDVTPQVEPLSLDEAFLDVIGAYRLFGGPIEIARTIRARVSDELGITCSVGISVNKLLAKLASDSCKPDGLLVVPPAGVLDFLHPLPVRRLWGVGETTAVALARVGLTTIGELAQVPVDTLRHVVGDAAAQQLAELAWGRDVRAVSPDEQEKSVGAEITFARDTSDAEQLTAELLRLSDRVARRLRASGLRGRTVTLKVRFEDFTTITRSRTMVEPTDVGHQVFAIAQQLFRALNLQRARIRLLGVRLTGITPADEEVPQAALFADVMDDWSAVERVADRALQRFGDDAIRPARLLSEPASSTQQSPSQSPDE